MSLLAIALLRKLILHPGIWLLHLLRITVLLHRLRRYIPLPEG